jgi:hypothetical protein
MPFQPSHVRARIMTPGPSDAREACFCAADLLSAMQGLWAAVTDSEAADQTE